MHEDTISKSRRAFLGAAAGAAMAATADAAPAQKREKQAEKPAGGKKRHAIGFNGMKGRLDARIYDSQPWEVDRLADIRLTRKFKGTLETTIGQGGSNWGADDKMKDMIFYGSPDPLGQTAGTRAGAMSILNGIVARHCIEQNRKIPINEMVKI